MSGWKFDGEFYNTEFEMYRAIAEKYMAANGQTQAEIREVFDSLSDEILADDVLANWGDRQESGQPEWNFFGLVTAMGNYRKAVS